MTNGRYPCIAFSQYGSPKPSDNLLLFAAPASRLMNWAGVPRKAWQMRMLFQRPITPRREQDLKTFWNTASKGDQDGFILGPAAIVIAIQGEPNIEDGKIDVSFEPVVDILQGPKHALPKLVEHLYPSVRARLGPEQAEELLLFEGDPFGVPFPDVNNDYVFEFALQLAQMRADVEKFARTHAVDEKGLKEIAGSMEQLTRPAIVVDGQHRLHGAAQAEREVVLPVVAMPHCSWTEQIYQFVVINETAQKVETSLLTDIFGSSLTQGEQEQVRGKLARARVDVEGRIAAVVASRDPNSPFHNMVLLRIEGTPPSDRGGYLSEAVIRSLIDGRSQYARGWRSDDDFYDAYVAPTYPNRAGWDSWTDGAWRAYWLEFWRTVRDHYNAQGAALRDAQVLWSTVEQTNLTKAVTLRVLQSLFMDRCVKRMQELDRTVDILREALGKDEADERVAQMRKERAIPESPEAFGAHVQEFFLDRGVPVKVFLARWRSSLDTSEGQLELWETLERAFDRTQAGKQFPVRGGIFLPQDPAPNVAEAS